MLGTIEQDRLAGLLGTTTRMPPSTPTQATFTNLDTGSRLSKVSHAVDPDLTVDLAATHIYATAQRTLDAWAAGEARIDWGVSGTVNGKAWSLRRHDAWGSGWDIVDEMTWMLFEKLHMLTEVGSAKVALDRVWVTGTLTEETVRSRVSGVEVRKRGGGWADLRADPVVKKGAPLRLRVTVASSDGSRDVVTRTMGKARAGKTRVAVRGGGGRDVWVEGPFAVRLAALRSAPSGDHAYLSATRKGQQRQAAVAFDHVVTGKVTGAVRAR